MEGISRRQERPENKGLNLNWTIIHFNLMHRKGGCFVSFFLCIISVSNILIASLKKKLKTSCLNYKLFIGNIPILMNPHHCFLAISNS